MVILLIKTYHFINLCGHENLSGTLRLYNAENFNSHLNMCRGSGQFKHFNDMHVTNTVLFI